LGRLVVKEIRGVQIVTTILQWQTGMAILQQIVKLLVHCRTIWWLFLKLGRYGRTPSSQFSVWVYHDIASILKMAKKIENSTEIILIFSIDI